MSKTTMGIAILLSAFGLVRTYTNYQEQEKINAEAKTSEQILKQKQTELENLRKRSRQTVVKTKSGSQSATQIETENLVNSKAHALFKLLCNVNPNISTRVWNSRQEALLKYADKDVLNNTQLIVDDLSSVKKFDRKSELLSLHMSYDVFQGNIVKGLAQVQVQTQGPNPKPTKDTYVYKISFDKTQQKFVKIEWENTLDSQEL